MAVGQSFSRSEQILGRDEGFVAQQAAEGLDFFLGPMGEVGQGALAGFVAFASALAEEDGGRGVAVGDGLDVHGSHYAHLMFTVKTRLLITWEHFHRDKFDLRSNKSETYLSSWADLLWNFGLRSLTQNIHPESALQELAYHSRRCPSTVTTAMDQFGRLCAVCATGETKKSC
jgi:hypothetical protein